MNKKEMIIPLLVIGLTLLFAGVCIAVFLTKGRSAKWISRKMKIGGLLLMLTAISCNKNEDEVYPTCYIVALTNEMWVQTNGKTGIEINLDTGNVFTGGIYGVEGNQFSFAVIDQNNTKLQTGEISALDGTYDESDEEFKIELDQNLTSGDYFLDLFATNVNGQADVSPQSHINLKILD